eukprot:2434496-Pleurochrysis_carterae.AAC.2
MTSIRTCASDHPRVRLGARSHVRVRKCMRTRAPVQAHACVRAVSRFPAHAVSARACNSTRACFTATTDQGCRRAPNSPREVVATTTTRPPT